MRRLLSLLLLFMFCVTLTFTGCAASLNQWEGSVDAVFRYRSSESSTVVHEIKPKSFSEEAGLKPGDLVLAIDETDVKGATFQEVRNALRGPVGTTVVLTVQRGGETLDIPVERRPVSKK